MLDGRFDPSFEHLFRNGDEDQSRQRRILIAIFLGALPFAAFALLAAFV